ncbi:MAG: aspartate aminotransferase family protein [Pseudomonadota bacterium]
MMAETNFGSNIGSLRTEIPGPQSKALAQRLGPVEAPGITYLANDFPVFWKKALGSNVEDADGNVFVDLTAAFGVAMLGHSNPAVAGAIASQARELPHGMGDVHPPAVKVELLEALARLAPMPEPRTILCSSGAEAVEAALKTALLYTGLPGVISFENSYHGLTLGALAVTGIDKFREPFAGLIPRFSCRARFPHAADSVEASIRELGEIVEEAQDGELAVGAVLLEPIQGRAGVILPPEGWLKAVADLARQKGILLIVDEIFTGFGRTGSLFAVQHEGVTPDLLCVGKALTGSLPFSACIGTAKVMKKWPKSEGEALHTSTFLGHPLGCAAALAAIREGERLGVVQRAAEVGKRTLEKLRTWKAPLIKEVRGRGLMIGIELSGGLRKSVAFEAARRALKRGVIVLPAGINGNVLSITPPLTIEESQLDWALGQLNAVISEMT